MARKAIQLDANNTAPVQILTCWLLDGIKKKLVRSFTTDTALLQLSSFLNLINNSYFPPIITESDSDSHFNDLCQALSIPGHCYTFHKVFFCSQTSNRLFLY